MLTPEEIARQRAVWEDQCERRAVAAQEAGLPPPVLPDFVPKEGPPVAYLVCIRDKRTGLVRDYDVYSYYVRNEAGEDLAVPPPINKSEARGWARSAGYILLEDGLQEQHLRVLYRLREHYGTQWKRHLRNIWGGIQPPYHMRNDAPLIEEMRKNLGPSWLISFKLLEDK